MTERGQPLRGQPRALSEDEEVARVAEGIARNRRAVALAIGSGLLVANAIFWGIGYGLPDAELGLSVVAGSIGAGAFVGLIVWAAVRSRSPVFERVSIAPEASDAETRALEARARAHDAQNRRALAVAAIVAVVAGPGGLYAWSAHLDALNETREHWERASLGLRDVTIALVAALSLAGLAWRLLRARLDVLAELGGVTPGQGPREAGPTTAELADLRSAGAEVRAAQRREALGHAITVGAGLATSFALLFGIDHLYARSPDAHLGGGELGLAVMAGLGVAVVVSRLVAREGTELPAPATRADDRDWFHDTLGTTGSLTVSAPSDLESIVERFFRVATNHWSVLDGSGASFCEASEVELPLWRRALPWQTRAIEVRDLDRRPLRVEKQPRLWGGEWTVLAEGERTGAIEEGWIGLVVRDAGGGERLRVRRSWLSRRKYVITRAGAAVATMSRPRPGLFASALDAPPGLRVELPRDATLEDRRLLLAAALLLDLDRA